MVKKNSNGKNKKGNVGIVGIIPFELIYTFF